MNQSMKAAARPLPSAPVKPPLGTAPQKLTMKMLYTMMEQLTIRLAELKVRVDELEQRLDELDRMVPEAAAAAAALVIRAGEEAVTLAFPVRADGEESQKHALPAQEVEAEAKKFPADQTIEESAQTSDAPLPVRESRPRTEPLRLVTERAPAVNGNRPNSGLQSGEESEKEVLRMKGGAEPLSSVEELAAMVLTHRAESVGTGFPEASGVAANADGSAAPASAISPSVQLTLAEAADVPIYRFVTRSERHLKRPPTFWERLFRKRRAL
ncbi:hypothetical protein [Gorillibacterium sp. sgz5001074]|uniref:hypothetical protein n=1 Tax=Gorillibacterium sp. sgz5001074 TaxID=3446695 RepID=UPI003F6727AC